MSRRHCKKSSLPPLMQAGTSCDLRLFTTTRDSWLKKFTTVQLASLISEEGFADMTTEDVDELIGCHSEPLSKQDLEVMTKSASGKKEEETQEQADETVEQSRWSLEHLAELFGLINKVKERSQEWDDDMVRSVQFCNKADELMTLCKMIFDRQKRQKQQLPITMFLQPSKKEKVSVANAVVEGIINEEEGVDSPSTEEEVVSPEKASPSEDM